MKINKVLLVDDDRIANYQNTEVIKKNNFAHEIIVKENAREALDYIITECKKSNKYPDLVLLDIKMPEMDGFEFIEIFEAGCRKIPHNVVLIILTNSRDADDILRLRALGNYFFINKPLTQDKLTDLYIRYFKKHEAHF